jgi:hypothetical protein
MSGNVLQDDSGSKGIETCFLESLNEAIRVSLGGRYREAAEDLTADGFSAN